MVGEITHWKKKAGKGGKKSAKVTEQVEKMPNEMSYVANNNISEMNEDSLYLGMDSENPLPL